MREAFDVTQQDIDEGERSSSVGCPISRAIKRVLKLKGKQADGLLVDTTTLEYEGEDCDVTLATFPKSVVDFLDKFDEEERVEPFSFTLDINKRNAAKAGIKLP